MSSSAINGLGNLGQNLPVQRVAKAAPAPVQKQLPTGEAPRQLPAADRLELSGVGHLLQRLKQADIRADKVADIKAQIEAGTYEDEGKLDVAVDRLLDELLR